MSPEERSGADAFFADLMGWSHRGPARAESTSSGLGVESFAELFEPGLGPESTPEWSAEDDPGCPPPGPIPATCTGITVPEVIDCFAYNGSTVLARHQPKIIGICRCIIASQTSSTPITTLRIVGHADASGDAGPNEGLGRRRAEAVKASIESTLSRMTGNRPPRLTITVDTRGEREVLPGPAALSRRVEVFPPFAYPLPCPSGFAVTPSSTTIAAGTSTVLRATETQSARPDPVTYRWTTSSTKILLAGASSSPQVTTGASVTVRAGNQASPASGGGEEIVVTRTQTGCAPLVQRARVFIDCTRFQLRAPRVIAVATDSYLTPTNTIIDPALLGGYRLRFGQDVTFATGRAQPHGPSQGTTTGALDPVMRRLLTVFASDDTSGKARRLFNSFLTPQTAVTFWSDPDLTAAANTHANITTFIDRSMSSPISSQTSPGKTRIHQALRNAGWDINAAVAPTDLGVPAFNLGSKEWSTQDFGNGLGVMINGLQHVIVVAREYRYDACRNEYFIRLEYNFYDVFGLDDDDLREFGADGGIDTNASRGITAWWQLQHQHGYAPIITKITLDRSYTVPAR